MTMKLDKEKIKELTTLDDKKRQVIYCICVVVALVVLSFGDRIVLHFIQQVPNNNNRIFGESGEITAGDYKIDFLEELTVTDILQKIQNQESFTLLSSRDSCHTCVQYIPLLKEVFDKYEVDAYYMNRSLYDRDNEEYVTLLNQDERLKKNLQYTPYIMVFKNGKLVDELVGSKNKEEVEEFVLRNNLATNNI